MKQANGSPAKTHLERESVNYRQEGLHFTRLMADLSGAPKLPHKEESFTVSRSGPNPGTVFTLSDFLTTRLLQPDLLFEFSMSCHQVWALPISIATYCTKEMT
jgi:hypothetical protein